jgi:hypothetical protein
MSRFTFGLISAIALILAIANPAGAITNGVPDNGAHPYVGLVVFYDADGVPQWRCSGTLISANVFLTAGHCTDGAASAQVWFDEHVTTAIGYPYEGGITGTPITHPDFSFVIPNTHDLGLVILDKKVRDLGYGAIAELGTLDYLATKRGQHDVWFTTVGYGLQEVKPVIMAERSRLMATAELINLESALTDGYNLQTTNAKGTGGGNCSGDSGGPIFLNDTNIIVAVNSFGLNANCVGSDFAYRVDIQEAHDFIYGV